MGLLLRMSGCRGGRLTILAVSAFAVLAMPSTAGAVVGSDSLAGAPTVPSGAYRDLFSEDLSGATKEDAEPAHAGDPGGTSLWYRWTVPTNGTTTIAACAQDPDRDLLLAVYTGTSIGNLSLVAENDDGGECGKSSLVSFTPAVGGTQYLIAVDAKAGSAGEFDMSFANELGNDDFADAQPLTGSPAVTPGHNFDATSEPFETRHNGYFPRGSVWYAWTAPASGTAVVDTCANPLESAPTGIGVHLGDEVGSVISVPYTDFQLCDRGERVAFEATAGTVYMLAVESRSSDGGEFELRVELDDDTEPPDTLIYNVRTAGSDVTVSFRGRDPFPRSTLTRFECRLDGADLAPCAQTKTFRRLDPGMHMIRARAYDKAGNRDPTPAVLRLRIPR